MQSHDLTGRQIGPYKLTRKLGAGGMGAVYESYQASVQRRVAIKVLPTHLAQETGYLERFKREVELAARLEHPHILPVYDHGTDGDISYIVMRLLRGGTLTQRLRKEKQLPFEEAVKILRQVGSALDYAHQEGVIHRDLKPSNVMFDKVENAYLADFGISKLVQESTSALTGTGQLIGTPTYMAPEQWEGLNADARTDIYALGVLAYTILTGQTPFEAPTPLGLMRKHMFDQPTPPTNLMPDLPAGIDGVIARALAKRPDDRYQTAKDFVDDMIRSVHGEVADVGYVTSNAFSLKPESERATGTARPSPTVKQADLDATITDQLAAGAMSGKGQTGSIARTIPSPSGQELATDLGARRAGGRGGLLIAGILVVLAAIAVVAFFILTRDNPDDDDAIVRRNANSTATAEMETLVAQQEIDTTATESAIQASQTNEAVLQATRTIEAAENADATVVAEALDMEERGDAAFEANNFAEAIVRYSDSIAHYPVNAQTYVKRARAYLALGEFDEALADANQALELDSANVDAHHVRGDVNFANQAFQDAIDDYSAVISGEPENFLVLLKRADTYTEISDSDAALEDLARAIEISPEFAAAFNARGDIYADLGDFDLAIEAFTQAIRFNPGFIEARFSRGMVYIRDEQFESARIDFVTVLDLRPDFVESYRGLGDVYYFQGDLELALENYQTYLREAGAGARNRGLVEERVEEIQSAIATANAPTPTLTNTPTPTPTITPTEGPTATPTISVQNQLLAEQRVQEGIDFYNAGSYDQAIVAFTDAINLNPSLPVAFNNRGVTYQQLENLDAALNDYLAAISIDPNYALAYRNAGTIYYLQEEYALALEYYRHHVELAGDNASQIAIDRIPELEAIVGTQNATTPAPSVTPRITRTPGPRPTGIPVPTVSTEDEAASTQFAEDGDAYYAEGDYQAAILSYNRAIGLNPGNVNAINNRGNAYFSLNQFESALLDYNRAIQIDPNSSIFYYNRANTHRQMGDYFSALRDYDEAIFLDDRDSDAYYGRGFTYYLIEDYELALSDFGRSLELGFGSPESIYNVRGLTYYEMGNVTAARADFDRAINLDPEFDLPYYNLANLEYDEGNLEEALANYERYVELADVPFEDAVDRIAELEELTGN